MAKRKKPVVTFEDKAVSENLPYPYVIYPKHGAFIGFKLSEDASVSLCSCYFKAVTNYIELRKAHRPRFAETDKSYIVSSMHFPTELVESLVKANVPEEEVLSHLSFVDNLCHKCNRAMTSCRYTDEMYGGLFMQNYGWYVNQKWFEYGIDRIYYRHLDGEVPELIQVGLKEIQVLNEAREVAHKKWVESDDPEISKGKSSISNHPLAVEFRRLFFAAEPFKKDLADFMENETRADFGYRKIGDAWVGETDLFHIVERLFPKAEIHRHYRPNWMEGLELDIYLPELKVAIEYQGHQHYRPVKHWGGEENYLKLVERDKRKKQICKAQSIRLFEFKYDDPLDEQYVRKQLKNYLTSHEQW